MRVIELFCDADDFCQAFMPVYESGLLAIRMIRSQSLFEQLLHDFDIQLITKLKSNMKNRLINFADKLLLRKRAIVECIIDQLKNFRRSSILVTAASLISLSMCCAV